MRKLTSALGTASLLLATAGVLAPAASADTVGPIGFEPTQGYHIGNINGQPAGTANSWSKTGPYDANVAAVAAFPNASAFGSAFGTQALQVSDAVTSGSFGDQTFSPGLTTPASASGLSHFDASFMIATTQSTQQGTDTNPLHMSVSPDSGDGSRMSYLRFEDHADGVHVFFDDVKDPGRVVNGDTFNETDIATLSRTSPHLIRFSIDLKNGFATDLVKIYIDGKLLITGTTWKDYYLFDTEQAGNGNKVPSVDKLLFRESGTADSADAGQGFLIDEVSLASSVK